MKVPPFPLLLRPWSLSDASALRAAIDEDVQHLKPWLSWTLGEPATVEATRGRLGEWIEDHQSGSLLRLAITSAHPSDEIVGGVTLGCRAGPDAYDLGYWVGKAHAGQGVAGAAAAAMTIHAFASSVIDRIVLRCDEENERSVGFASALGFRPTGGETMRYPNGSPRPVLRFEMGRELFRERHPLLQQRSSLVTLPAGLPTPTLEVSAMNGPQPSDTVQLRFLISHAERIVDGLDDSHRAVEPIPGGKTAGWILGHLATSGDFARVVICGRERLCPRGWGRRFGPGTTPSTDPSDYPPMEEMTDRFFTVHRELLEMVSDGSFAASSSAPNPFEPARPAFPTAGEFARYIVLGHLGYHLGQLTAWRSAAGLPSVGGSP